MTSKEKQVNELSITDMTDLKIVFAPGCFDNFDGTQEELDQLMSEITHMVETGALSEQAELVDIDTLMEEDPEWADQLLNSFSADSTNKRTLQ